MYQQNLMMNTSKNDLFYEHLFYWQSNFFPSFVLKLREVEMAISEALSAL